LYLFLQSSIAIANPVVMTPAEDPIYMLLILILIFFIGVTIEYFVIHRFLLNVLVSKRALSKSILKVNIVTFPLTQVFAYFIALYFGFLFWLYVIFIEIIVILIEWGLYQMEFKTFNSQNLPLSEKIFLCSAIANICSFIFGLFIFIPQFFFI